MTVVAFRVVSGGQTGVDRAALDAAIHAGIPHGGWCPRGRRAEDGPISAKYQLRETEHWNYGVRTKRNVQDSDATLILFCRLLSGGTELTLRCAREQAKPCFLVDLSPPDHRPLPWVELSDAGSVVETIQGWIDSGQVHVLNVAGPRESTCPGIYHSAYQFLCPWFHRIAAVGP